MIILSCLSHTRDVPLHECSVAVSCYPGQSESFYSLSPAVLGPGATGSPPAPTPEEQGRLATSQAHRVKPCTQQPYLPGLD